MTGMIIAAVAYLAGALLSYGMLRVEHAAEKRPFTYGDRILCWTLSGLSWMMVLITLVRAWVGKIGKTGFWDKPVNPKAK